MSADAKGEGFVPSKAELDAIRKVESGGCFDPLNAVGDQGLSIGPYQIQECYYADAKAFDPTLPSYESLKGPGSIANSERVMQAYSRVYTTKTRLGREPTFEDFARNHNGGPDGYKKESTLGYFEKVQRCLHQKD